MDALFEQALAKIKNGDNDNGRGCYSRFYRLNDTWGFKCSQYQEEMQFAYYAQQLGAEHLIAPRVGGAYSFHHNDIPYFGYITECAGDTWEKTGGKVESCYGLFPVSEEFDALVALVYDLFGNPPKRYDINPHYDLHFENVAFMPDNRLVAIDWGTVGMYATKRQPQWSIQPWEC